MKSHRIITGLIVAGLLMIAALPLRAEVKTGEPAPDFTLIDTQGMPHKFSDHTGKYVVLEWVNSDCPFVKKHYDSQNMQSLQKEYTGKDVIWLAINSSAPGKEGNYFAEDINKIFADWQSAPTAILLDPDGTVGKSYGAKTTPHMYVVNPEGVLVYQGAIDSIPSVDTEDIAKASNYVKQALEESMAGQEVSIPATKSYGCSVKY